MMNSNQKLSVKEGWVSIAGNVVLFVAKLWAGLASGSIAIIADAWHTLSDSLTSLIVIVGTRISAKPADKEHPFGHGRAELIAALIIGVLLFVVAFNFVVESFQRLSEHRQIHYGTFAIVVTAISVLVKEAMARYAFIVAKKTGSESVKADGWHHRSDAISSLVILGGIYLGQHVWWIDAALGMVVALLISLAAYSILRDGMRTMLGESPEEELKETISEVCRRESMLDLKPHHFHVHRYGDHIEMTMHIKLPDNMTVFDAHEIATRIEKRLLEENQIVITIHIEPAGFTH
ncbi:MAG: cation diffusion facilitator family transporter [Lentimicrobiaceae bacterium]|nr:cation diffusion facilitator family transporter [Lentimicrobiaceae bacterium]